MAPTPYVALHPPAGLARWPRRRPCPRSRSGRAGGAGGCWARRQVVPDHAPGRATAGGRSACTATVCGCCRTRDGSTPGPRHRGRSAWSASTARRALGGGHGVRRHPAVPRRRPAAPDQLAGLGPQPRAARHHLAGRGGQRRAARGRRAGDHGHSGASTARRAASTQSVRAAAAVAEHHIRAGDRVGLRIVGRRRRAARVRRRHAAPAERSSTCWPGSAPASSPRGARTGSSSGRRRHAWCSCSRRCSARPSSRRPPACVQRGLPVVVVDTLPAGAAPRVPDGDRPAARRPRVADAPAGARPGARRPRRARAAR